MRRAAAEAAAQGAPRRGLLPRLLDWAPAALALALAAAGGALLVSAGGGDPDAWARPHAARVGLGAAAMLAAAAMPGGAWPRLALPLWALGVALLVAVEASGAEANSARRWLELPGGARLQPSEPMRVALALALARVLARAPHGALSRRPWLLLAPAALVAAPLALVLRQPDLGGGLTLLALGAAALFAAGLHLWWFAAAAAAAAAALPLAWSRLHDYQRGRLLSFLDPEADPLGAGWHVLQSKIALGSGGAWGKGWLGGTQSSSNFLPEKHTDFVFAVLAEEFGLAGALSLLGLYCALLLSMLAVAWRVRDDPFARVLAPVLCVNLALNVFVNIGMVSGLLPVVGLPLPLVSYGGSAAVSTLVSVGILVSLSRPPAGGHSAPAARHSTRP